MAESDPSACPVARDERKSAALAAERCKVFPGSEMIDGFDLSRTILRNPAMKQAGLGAEQAVVGDPSQAPVFFLDGDDHRRKRATIARYFTPKMIATRHRAVMEAWTNRLLGELRANGRIQLDEASWSLAVAVASDIVGLTKDDMTGLGRRIEGIMEQTDLFAMKPLARFFASIPVRLKVLHFHLRDVRPAIRARVKQRQDDIISHLIDEGYSEAAILIECMTYSAAGMATTREFITMVAWHLFDNAAIRERFLASDEQGQLAILEEILRLEPVATYLYRRSEDGVPPELAETIAPNRIYALDMRAANADEAATGACPHMIDPDRAGRMKVSSAYMSFGDGPHRCPGAQVAMAETRIFIDRLFRVPGLRLTTPPAMRWNDTLMSYELRGAIVECERL